MTDSPTLAQLWSAAHVCHDCGTAWGSPRIELEHVTCWHATCHICGLETEIGRAHV